MELNLVLIDQACNSEAIQNTGVGLCVVQIERKVTLASGSLRDSGIHCCTNTYNCISCIFSRQKHPISVAKKVVMQQKHLTPVIVYQTPMRDFSWPFIARTLHIFIS